MGQDSFHGIPTKNTAPRLAAITGTESRNASTPEDDTTKIRNKQIIDASAFRPGTGNLTQHRLTDEEAEYERIQREIKRLKLRG